MSMKTILALYFICSISLLPAFRASAAEAPASNINLSTRSEVPGMTLQPGSYSIHVIGKLSDRVILKVDEGSGKRSVYFIGIPNRAIKGSPGIISWSQPIEGTTYLRGWVPPGSSSLIEFVYAKDEAVSIAKVNQAKVPAIDPASEGRNVDPTLSTEDMKLVTLWLLSSTRVGPSDSEPSIKAERYQTGSYVQPKPALAALPHTASSLPIILVASLLSFAMAILLRWGRMRSSKSGEYSRP
jgi:hypothetical protein